MMRASVAFACSSPFANTLMGRRSAARMNTVAEKSSTGLDANVAAALTYIPVIAIVFLVIEKGSKLVKFHAVQSLGLLVAWMVTWFVLGIIGMIPVLGWATVLLWPLVAIGMFVVWLYALLKAFKGEWWKLPVIGDIAEQQSANL
jgi:uncharacterized membrane protein